MNIEPMVEIAVFIIYGTVPTCIERMGFGNVVVAL